MQTTRESLPPGWENLVEYYFDEDTRTICWEKPYMLCPKNLEQYSSNESSKTDSLPSCLPIHISIF